MTSEFFHIAAQNLRLIAASPNECLHKDQFRYDWNQGVYQEEMIDFLVAHEFIETEQDDDVYFLTTETYDLLGVGDLEFMIYARATGEEPESFEPDWGMIDEPDDLPESEQGRIGNIPIYVVMIIIAIGITWYSYQYRSNSNGGLPPEIDSKELNESIRIQLDSALKEKGVIIDELQPKDSID